MKKILLGSLLFLFLFPIQSLAAAAPAEINHEGTSPSSETSSETMESFAESGSVTTESTTTSSPAKQESSKDTEVISKFIKEQIGETKAEDLTILDTSTAAGIRKILLEGNYYHIDKAELDQYSDSQLMNTMTLFERYNADIYGMDMGAYVEVLRALYKDRTLSWETVSKELSFVPSDFNSFKAMIAELDQLQAYLKALYPTTSSFLAAKSVSNEDLIAILEYLQTVEDHRDEELWPGRIAWIIQQIDEGVPTQTSTTDSSEKQENSTPIQNSSAKEAANKNDTLLQTGEDQTVIYSIVGVIMLFMIVLIFYRKRKERR